MAYSFFLDGVQLPIAPPSLSIKIKNQNKTITLINEGEINVLKVAGLTNVTFDVRIPQTNLPFARYSGGFKGAEYFLNRLEQLKVGQEPFQFVVSRILPSGRSLFDTNMRVTLEDYDIRENAIEGFDLIIKINLKQYRGYGTKIVKISPAEEPTAEVTKDRPGNPPKAETYTVVRGDSLWNIAKKHLGSGAKYKEIYNLNKGKIKNPNLIFPGQVLIMP